MLEKKEIACVAVLRKGPFYYEYLVVLKTKEDTLPRYILRAIHKRAVVNTKIDEEMVLNELYIRSNIRHPFMVNQVLAFQDYDTLFYMTEYAPAALLKTASLPLRLPMSAVRFYGAEVFCALDYLHRKEQVFTFLSPDNVLLASDGHIKLDYVFCNGLNDKPDYLVEMIEYVSPVYLKKNTFTRTSDYWSLGIILYRLAVGYTPFGCESASTTVQSILARTVEFPDFIEDRSFKDLVRILLGARKDTPALGSSLDDAEIIMGHPFFTGLDWDRLRRKEYVPPYIPSVETVPLEEMIPLSDLYTSDFIVGENDGYGNTFKDYNIRWSVSYCNEADDAKKPFK